MTGEAISLERADLAACYKLCANAMCHDGGTLSDVFHMADAMHMPREAVAEVSQVHTDGIRMRVALECSTVTTRRRSRWMSHARMFAS